MQLTGFPKTQNSAPGDCKRHSRLWIVLLCWSAFNTSQALNLKCLQVFDRPTAQVANFTLSDKPSANGLSGSLFLHLPANAGAPADIPVATLNYKFSPSGTSVEIVNIDVLTEYQRQGLARFLFKNLLGKNPQIKTVTAFLAKSNGNEFKKHFLEYKKQMPPALATKMALQKTPFYKSFSALGFTEIHPKDSYFDPFESLSSEQIRISLSRPH